MDHQGFRAMLEARMLPTAEIDRALDIAEKFEGYLQNSGEAASAETVLAYSKIQMGENLADYIALARYAFFIDNDSAYIALLEILDGAEVPKNLYKKVTERYGEAACEEFFDGIPPAKLGISPTKKPEYIQPVIERIEVKLGQEECKQLLADSLRDLPETNYLEQRNDYQNSQDIDDFLANRKRKFIENLQNLNQAGRPFFTQEVTDEVINFVIDNLEIGGGVRQDSIVYETKIPYLTKEFLTENDNTRKRYYYCHCPWAREAILSGESISPTFCNCSAGYHKRPWEVIFEKPVKADVLESVLRGDSRCRFAIHLPPEAIPRDDKESREVTK